MAYKTVRGSTKPMWIMDDYYSFGPNIEVASMIKRFRENTQPTVGYLIKQETTVAITIPPQVNMVHFLRLMYAEHRSGKLYIPHQPSVYAKDHYSNWSLIMWGGGRQHTKKIKCLDVRKDAVPKTLQLIELIHG